MPSTALATQKKESPAKTDQQAQNQVGEQTHQFSDGRSTTQRLASLSALASNGKADSSSSSPVVQRVTKLDLAGEVTFGAKFRTFFKGSTIFTRLKDKVETFNAQKTTEAQDPLKAEIISLCREWLGKHRTSQDDNDQTKEASITKILDSLTAIAAVPAAEVKAEEKPTEAEPEKESAPEASPASAAASSAVSSASATDAAEKTADPEDAVDDARKAYAEKQDAKVAKMKNAEGEIPDGFVGTMKSKMVKIVKDVQDNEGAIQQSNNLIHGDAAVNTYFSDQISKATTTEDFIKANVHADRVFNRDFKEKVMPNKQLQGGPIHGYKTSSLAAAKSGKRDVEDTAGDKVIVEMYYNELEKINKEEETPATKKKAESIYKFAKARQFDVRHRKGELAKKTDQLNDDGRINSMVRRTAVAVGYTIGSAVFKVITLGLGSFKPNLDKRGFNANEDFSLDFDTETATNEKFETGQFAIQGPLSQIRQHYGELTSKMAARKSNGIPGFFSSLSLGLEIFKRFLGIIKGVLSSLAIWSGIIAAIPGAQVMATVAAFCGTIAYYIGLAMSSITGLRLLLDGVAQMTNTNPALFAELSGETTRSAATLGIEGAAFANTEVGFAEARDKVNDRKIFDAPALGDPSKMLSNMETLNKGTEGMGIMTNTDTWMRDKSILASGVVSEGIISGGGLNAVAGKASVDNADMKYNETINPNRRIGQDTKKKATASDEETALIMASYKTTKKKAKKIGVSFVPVVKKFAGEPVPQPTITSDEISEKDKESAGKVPELGNMVTDGAATMAEGLEEMIKK